MPVESHLPLSHSNQYSAVSACDIVSWLAAFFLMHSFPRAAQGETYASYFWAVLTTSLIG
jgi:hypothetical protein